MSFCGWRVIVIYPGLWYEHGQEFLKRPGKKNYFFLKKGQDE